MSGAPFTVAASVGTYHHAFDRFADWLESWSSEHGAQVVFQHGATRPIRDADNHDMLPPARLIKLYKNADAVVLQGGAGGVMDARKAGRIPIIVPRRPVNDEVVDDHQIVLSRHLASMGLVHLAETKRDLARLLDGMKAGTINSRTDSRRPTAGVANAVKTLSAVSGGRPTREQRRSATAVLELDAAQPSSPPHASRAMPFSSGSQAGYRVRRDVRSIASEVVHQGVFGYILTFLAAWLGARAVDATPRATAVILAGVAIWLAYSFVAQPAYRRAKSFRPVVRLAVLAGIAAMGFILADLSGTEEMRAGLEVAVIAAAAFAVSALAHRLLLRRVATVLVGEEKAIQSLSQRWKDRRDVRVVATCEWRGSAELVPMTAPSSLAGIVPAVLGAVRRHGARSVVITSDRAMTTPALRHLAWALQRADVECLVITDVKDHVEYLRPRMVGQQVALTVRPPNDHLASRIVKSLFDRGLALLGLIILAPVLLIVAAAVRFTSPGPVIFKQERTGRDGAPFVIRKFRTMVADAEEKLDELVILNEGAGPLFKLSNDPRITRVGRFLRVTSLDELPQLINVLLGDMSLVGPRPALPEETAAYSEWMWRRLHVKPGITGLWQVSGRSLLTWEESIRVDLRYVNNWNLRLDTWIMIKTVGAVLRRDGAL